MSPLYRRPYSDTASVAKIPIRFWIKLSEAISYLIHDDPAWYGSDIKTQVTRLVENHPYDNGEPRPSRDALMTALRVIETVSKQVTVPQPEVSVFYGEIELSWRNGNRTVSLLSKGDARDMKIHKHEEHPGDAGSHEFITDATPERLIESLKWLESLVVEKWQASEDETVLA